MFTDVYLGATKIKSIFNGSTLIINNSSKDSKMKTVLIYGTSANFDLGLTHVVITKADGVVIKSSDISSCGELSFNLGGGGIIKKYNIPNYLNTLNSSSLVSLYQQSSNTAVALFYVFQEPQDIKSISVNIKTYSGAYTLDIAYSAKDCYSENAINYPNDIITLKSFSFGSSPSSNTAKWAK